MTPVAKPMPDTIILIPARMASTRLPGKPLADIAGQPMIVHVLRRARGRQNRRGGGGNQFPGGRRRGGKSRWPRGHDAGRSRLRLRPHLRGVASARSRAPHRHRGQCAGRPADHRSRRHSRRAGSARRPRRRYRNARGGDHRSGRAQQSERGQGRGPRDRARPLARRQLHPRRLPPGRARTITTSGFTPIGARRWSASSSCRRPPTSCAKSSSSCARSMPACASTWRWSKAFRSASIRRRNWRKRARCSPVDLKLKVCVRIVFEAVCYGQEEDHLPGRTGREFASRLPRSLSGSRAGALPDLRGLLLRAYRRRCRPRHDPDREFGRRPRRRHPSLDADVEAAHYRRMVSADPQSIDGAAGRDP